jgi:PIN domain-containing protein
VCFDGARRYIPHLAEQRHLDATAGLLVLDQIEQMVQRVDLDLYEAHEETARKRMTSRDVEDWPVLAAAILLDVQSGRKTATSLVAV